MFILFFLIVGFILSLTAYALTFLHQKFWATILFTISLFILLTLIRTPGIFRVLS